MEDSAEIFTRGGQDAGDNRGQSMVRLLFRSGRGCIYNPLTRCDDGNEMSILYWQVQQHAEKLQKAKETNSLAKLRALMPHIGGPTLDLALRECQWDPDRAASLLRMFAIAHAKDLGSIQKVQKVF